MKNLGPLAKISGVFLLVILLVAVFAPLLAPFSFETQNMDRILLGPNMINWFGTDGLGRDLFSRVLYGARVSMSVGVLTSVAALFLGVGYGALAGYRGGWLDSLMMRVIDVLQSFPHMVFLILVTVVFNSFAMNAGSELRSVTAIVVALSLTAWVNVARVARNQVLQLKELPYVESAVVSGQGTLGVLTRHIVPNMAGPMVVIFTYLIPTQILYESFLSFLGLGLQPPYSSWGVLANEGWRSFRTYPHLMIFPGVTLFVTMLACQLLGDGLRDRLDPKSRV